MPAEKYNVFYIFVRKLGKPSLQSFCSINSGRGPIGSFYNKPSIDNL